MGTDRTTVQQNIEKALENGNFVFCSYDVTVCFFFLFFIVLWNHWQPHSGALEHPAIVAVIDYTFRLKELHPALRVPCEDLRSKLESLSVQMFVYTVSGITGVEQHQNPSYKCIKWGLAKWALATLELICAMRVVIVEDELR